MDWVKEIRKNEDQALKVLYKTYRDDVILWLNKNYSIDPGYGADIFQQAVVLFYDKITQNNLPQESGNVKTYIYGICKNKARSYLRKSKKEKLLKQNYADTFYKPTDNQEDNFSEDKFKILYEVLDKIGNPCKKILELFYYKMYKIEEISNVLGYKNTNTAKNQKYKCIKRLQLMVLDIYR